MQRVILERFNDSFILIFSILSFIFVGIVIDRLIFGMDITLLISLLSFFVAVWGGALATRAYRRWRRKETEVAQVTLVREIIMSVVELEYKLDDTFGDLILKEGNQEDNLMYPPLGQKGNLIDVAKMKENINILMLKFYSINDKPYLEFNTNSSQSLLMFIHEEDPFKFLKEYLSKVGYILRYKNSSNILICENKVITSHIPNEFDFDIGVYFDGSSSYTELAMYFSDYAMRTRHDLKQHIF